MPAQLPRLNATLAKKQSQFATRPIQRLHQDIEDLHTKIHNIRRKKTTSQTLKRREKLKKEKEKEKETDIEEEGKKEKKKETAASPVSVTAIPDIAATKTKVSTETQNVEPETSRVEVERQEETLIDEKVVEEAWSKAYKAKAAAKKAIVNQKSLRSKGNAGSEKIAVARPKIHSRMMKATKLKIAAIFAEDGFQAAISGKTAVVDEAMIEETMAGEAAVADEAHEVVEEGYATQCLEDDSLSSWVSLKPQSPSPLCVPQTIL